MHAQAERGIAQRGLFKPDAALPDKIAGIIEIPINHIQRAVGSVAAQHVALLATCLLLEIKEQAAAHRAAQKTQLSLVGVGLVSGNGNG